MWDKVNYGYSITNVGRVDIPTAYDHMELDCVYGPFVYSDVNEKTVGVTTVGNKLTFVMSYNEESVNSGTAGQIEDVVTHKLVDAIQ